MAENLQGRAIPGYIDLIARSTINKPGSGDGSALGAQGAGGNYYGSEIITLPAGAQPVFLDPFQYLNLLNAFKPWRRAIRVKPFVVGAAPIELLPMDDTRTYFFIVNTSGANLIYVGFDQIPNIGNALPLGINGGSYEPLVVPTNAISVVGGGAGTTGLLYYAN